MGFILSLKTKVALGDKSPGFNQFPGVLVACGFDLAAYQFQAFSELGVDFPVNLAQAVDKRQAEFLAGRVAAKKALELINVAHRQVAVGANREPLWPKGIVGSITHHPSLAYCAVAPSENCQGIGVDVEHHLTPEAAENIQRLLVSSTEANLLAQQPFGFAEALTLVFSAKESLYKMLYPQVGRYFDFLDAELIELSTYDEHHEGRFTLRLKVDLTDQLKANNCYSGYYQRRAQDLLTLMHYA